MFDLTNWKQTQFYEEGKLNFWLTKIIKAHYLVEMIHRHSSNCSSFIARNPVEYD
jgi:hypothetical protein